MSLDNIMDSLNRRISDRKDYAARKGRWPKRLLDEYSRLYPDREITFGEWMNTLPASRSPASASSRDADSMSQKEWNREIDDLVGPTEDPISLPMNERYRPNVMRQERQELADLGTGYRELQRTHQKDMEELWRRSLPLNEQSRPNVKDPKYTVAKTETGERIDFSDPLLVEGEYWSPEPTAVRFDAPPMDKLVRPQDEKTYSKERVAKPYEPPVEKKGRKILVDDDKDEAEGGYQWGSALGKGLAAFGDAFALAGGAKTSFLDNIMKAERLKEKQPWERFKTFTKLLQAEINNDLLQQYRLGGLRERKASRIQSGEQFKKKAEQFKQSQAQKDKQFYVQMEAKKATELQNWILRNRDYNLKLKKYDLASQEGQRNAEKFAREVLEKTPNSVLTKHEMQRVLYDEGHNVFPPWLHKMAKEDPVGFMKQTAKEIQGHASKYSQVRTALLKKGPQPKMKDLLAKHKSPEEQAIISESFKKPLKNITPLEFAGFSKTIPKKVGNLDAFTAKQGKWLNFSKKIVTNTRAIIKAIGEQLGVPAITRDQLQADAGRNEFWFIPKDEDGRLDRSRRRKIDLAGMQLPGGGELTSAIDIMDGNGWAGLLKQLAEKSYAPERRANFGASQSFIELDKYTTGIGGKASFQGREVAMMNYLLGLGDAAQKGLTTYSRALSGKAGGKYRLNLEGYNYAGYYNPETKKYVPQYSDNEVAAVSATKAYSKNKNEDGSVEGFRMPPFWNETIKKVQEAHKSGKHSWYFHYPQRYEKGPDGKTIKVNSNQDPDIIGTFTKYKVGSGDDPNNWVPAVWLEFIRQYGINPRRWD